MRRLVALLIGSVLVSGGDAGAVVAQLPNLVPLPAEDMIMGRDDTGQLGALRFDMAVANRGAFTFDLLGIPTDPAQSAAEAHQCVVWAAPRVCTERQQIGRFVWHPSHGHWHFEDFALYELRRLDASGNPDMSAAGLAATGGKISFCLLDYETDSNDREPAYLVGNPVYDLCELGNQGIDPGWRDRYERGLPGQYIKVNGVPDGEYAIVVTIDPDQRIHQMTRSDDVSSRRVRLFDNGTKVEAL